MKPQMNANGRRLVVKKLFVKLFLVIIIVCILLMIMLWLRSSDGGGTAPSYRFLAGRSPVACRDGKTGSVDKCYIYSFVGDFNDVCLKSNVELIGEGFIDRTLPANRSNERDYWLPGKFLRGPIKIKIYNNRAYNEKYNAIGDKDDWIVVEILYWRGWW